MNIIPASDSWQKCNVNMVVDVDLYPSHRWRGDGVVVTLQGNKVSPKYAVRYHAVVADADKHGVVVGRYLSGGDCRYAKDLSMYPPESVRREDLKDADLMPVSATSTAAQFQVNLGQEVTRRKFRELLVKQLHGYSRPLVMWDNVRHPGSGAGFDWQLTCDFFGDIGREFPHVTFMANINPSVGVMSDIDVLRTMIGFDGVCVEDGLPALARGEVSGYDGGTWLNTVLKHYRRVLDGGRAILLTPLERPGRTLAREALLLAALAMCIRRRGDRLYVAWPFFLPNPEWCAWPGLLGVYDEVPPNVNFPHIARRFPDGTLLLDVSTGDVKIDGSTIEV